MFEKTYDPNPDTSGNWISNESGTSTEHRFCIVTDGDGAPLFMEPTYDIRLPRSRMMEIHRLVIGNGCPKCIVILESDSGHADNLSRCVDMDYAVPALRRTPFVKNMMSQVVKNRTDQNSIRHFDGKTYVAYDSEVAIVPRKIQRRIDCREEDDETPDFEIILPTDQRFFSIPLDLRISAWACLEYGSGPDDGRERMSRRLADIEEQLRAMDPYDAVDSIRDIAREFSRYLDVRVVEGELEIKVRQKGVSAALNREGIFVVMSHGVRNWNDIMRCARCRSIFQRELNVMQTNLTTGSVSGRASSIMESMAVKFCALTLWSMCTKRLSEAGINMPVSTAMQILDTVMAIGDGSIWRISEVSPAHRSIYEALHVPLPGPSIPSAPYEYAPGMRTTDMMDRQTGSPGNDHWRIRDERRTDRRLRPHQQEGKGHRQVPRGDEAPDETIHGRLRDPVGEEVRDVPCPDTHSGILWPEGRPA